MNTILLRLSQNKHTSAAGAIWLVASALENLGPLWFPNHANQFQKTAHWIGEAAVAYGFATAGDARKDTPPPIATVQPPTTNTK